MLLFTGECLMRSEMLHHLALYAIQFSFMLTQKKIPLLIFNLFIAYFSCRFHVKNVYDALLHNTQNDLKNICLCLYEFKHTNIHTYMHVLTAPFQYQIPCRRFFWRLLYQISAHFCQMTVNTVQANFILYRIMTYYKIARGKNK